MVCRRGNNPLGNYNKFEGMSQEEQWDMVRKGALYKNCLKPAHFAGKCHTLPMCKRCDTYHHTLFHIKADSKMEETKKVSKNVT